MHSVQTERYSFSLFNWEIALIFCWTNLRYLVIFTIDSYQERFWSASLDIDCNTPICTCIDTENLAETFIGKLLSEEQNQTDWKPFSIMYNLCKTIRIGKYAFTFDFYIHKEALIIEWLFESINPTRRISIEFNTSSFLLSYLDRLIGIEVDDIYNWKEIFICGYILSMNDTPVHIRCESIDKISRNSYEYPTILQR